MPGSVAIPDEPAVGMTTRVMYGGLWSLGGQGLILLASLGATPFVIRLLGPERYGAWAVLNVVFGYLGISDLGMGLASTRFGSAARARGDDDGEVSVVWTCLLLALLASLAAAACLLFASAAIVDRFFHIPAPMRRETLFALQLAGLVVLVRNLGAVLNTPILARLRMGLFVLISSGGSAAQVIAIPIVLASGGGLVAAVIAMLCVAAATTLTHGLVSRRLQPELRKPRPRRRLLGPLLRFGASGAASSLAALAVSSGEKLLLTRYASVTAMAHYSVAHAFASLLTVVPAGLGQALIPAFSRLQAAPDSEALQLLYSRMVRGILLWVAPVGLALCVIARQFFALWAGPEYAQSSTGPFYLLVVGMMANVMAFVPYTLLMAFERADMVARFHVAELVPFLGCAALLTKRYGAVGAALAATLQSLTDAALRFRGAKRISGFGFSPLPGGTRAYLAAVAVLAAPAALASLAASSAVLKGSILLVSLAAYGTLVWSRVLSGDERAWALGFIRSIRVNPGGANRGGSAGT